MNPLGLLHDDGEPFVISASKQLTDGHTQWNNTPFDSLVKAEHFATGQNKNSYNIHIKFALFDGAMTPAGRPKCSRANAIGSRTLAIDIDYGSGRHYPDLATTVNALAQAVTGIGLPPSNLLLDTGHGIHAAWVLDQVLQVNRWGALIAILYRLLGERGVKFDPVMQSIDKGIRYGTDDGHIINHKPPPAHVRLLHQGARIPIAQINAVLLPNTMTLVQPKKDGYSEYDIQGGGFEFNIEEVVHECPVLQDALTAGAGNNGPEHYDIWWRTVAQAARDNDDERGSYYAHQFSHNYPTYNPDYVDQKIADARQHPRLITCAEMSRYSPLCQTCAWFGKINSVGQIPKKKREAGLAALPLPGDYKNVAYGVVEGYIDPNTGKQEERVILRNYHIMGVELSEDQNGVETLSFMMRSIGVTGKARKVATKVAELRSVKSMVDAFGAAGLIIAGNFQKRVNEMMINFLDQMRARVAPKRTHTHLGWTEAGEFVTGGALHTKTASLEFEPTGFMTLYKPQGDLRKYMQAVGTIMASEQRPEAHMLISTAFAAPLQALIGLIGMTLCFWSTGSGHGKSTLMGAASGVWARPVLSVSSTSDTINATIRRAAQIKSMPWYFDDMTNQQIRVFIDSVLRQITAGREKSRLNAGMQLEIGGNWQTLFTIAANTSITSSIIAAGRLDQALGARYLDIELPKLPARVGNVAAINRAYNDINENCGLVGPAYAQLLVAKHDKIKDMLDRHNDFFIRASSLTGVDAYARFHSAAASCLIVGAKLASTYLQMPIDPQLVTKGVVDTLKNAQRVHKRDIASMSAEELVARFLEKYADRRVITVSSGNVGATAVLHADQPQPKGSVVYEINRMHRQLFVCSREFHRFVSENLQNSRQVWRSLQQHGAVEGYRALASRTKYATPRVATIEIPVVVGSPWEEML